MQDENTRQLLTILQVAENYFPFASSTVHLRAKREKANISSYLDDRVVTVQTIAMSNKFVMKRRVFLKLSIKLDNMNSQYNKSSLLYRPVLYLLVSS